MNTYNARGWSLALTNSIASSKSLTVTIGRIGAKISLKGARQSGLPTTGSHEHRHLLAHQRITRTDIPDDRRSNVFRLTVGVSAEDDGSLGVIQQFLDPVEASMSRETSNLPGFCRAIRVKFLISRYRGQRCRGGQRPGACVRLLNGGYKRLLSVFWDEDIIRGDAGLIRRPQ